MKTNELTGAALDWAVAKCEGKEGLFGGHEVGRLHYSTDWAQGGPIIERELCVATLERLNGGTWRVQEPYNMLEEHPGAYFYGPTPLIAAMRCYVASKLGDEVEIPEVLK